MVVYIFLIVLIDQIMVPTVETTSTTFWMEKCVAMAKAVMIVGPAGTGKTQLVMGTLREISSKPRSEYLTSKINMNFYTRFDWWNVG